MLRAPEAKNSIVPEFGSRESAEAECRRQNEELAKRRGESAYEIVVGECRWRAHVDANLPTIAAMIRELDDRQVAEIQIIENLQRKNPDPIEEAGGFRVLLDSYGYTPDTLAAKVGKSKAYVYAALKILLAPAKLLEKVRRGEVSASVAQLFGRIPSEAMRKEAFERLFRHQDDVSYRDAKSYIERDCMVELKGAAFDPKDAELTKAGACTVCPLRTGNAPDLYPGARADVCTNPACFREKVQAHGRKVLEAAQAEGTKVLDKSAKIFTSYGTLEYNSGYIDLDTDCRDAKKDGKWRALLGKDAKSEIVLATDPKGEVHELLPKAKAAKILRDKGLAHSTTPNRNGTRLVSPKDKLEEDVKKETLRRVFEAASASALESVSRCKFIMPPFWRPLAKILADRFYDDDAVLKLHKHEGDIPSLIDDLEGLDVVALLAQLALGAEIRYRIDDEALPLLTTLGIDPKEVEREVRAELTEAANSAAPKNGKAAGKGKR